MHFSKIVRSDNEKTARRAKVARLYLSGLTYSEIGKKVGVDKGTVCRDMRLLKVYWEKMAAQDIDKHKRGIITKLLHVYDEAMRAWERSKRQATKASTKQRTGDNDWKENAAERMKRDGDPRFLKQALAALDQLAKLLGVNAPLKVAPTDPSGEESYDLGKLTNDEVSRIKRRVLCRITGQEIVPDRWIDN